MKYQSLEEERYTTNSILLMMQDLVHNLDDIERLKFCFRRYAMSHCSQDYVVSAVIRWGKLHYVLKEQVFPERSLLRHLLPLAASL